MFLQNFKTFQVYSSLLIRFIAVFLNVISKLFKFTVHLAQPEGSDYYDIFQNFSSLQFIKLSLYDYKTNNKFQNFSSLQFINEEMTGGDFWI